jgi:hypothetical protein
MLIAFWIPLLALWHTSAAVRVGALWTLIIMMLTYLPVLKFYDRSPVWALIMPLVGTLYLAMTWASAVVYWRGRRACWKGRVYRAEPV